MTMTKEGRADVVVVGCLSQLPRFRKPRVEIAERWPEPPHRLSRVIR